MYIVAIVIHIILLILILYVKNKSKIDTSKGQKVLLGFAIFCSVGSLVLLDNKTEYSEMLKVESIMYSIIAIILYCIYIVKNRILSYINFKNLNVSSNDNRKESNNNSNVYYIYFEKDKILYKKHIENIDADNDNIEVSYQNIIDDINKKHQKFPLLKIFEGNVNIKYIFDKENKEIIDNFYNAFNDIFQARKKWYISSRTYNTNIKASYGGASSSINQVDISISNMQPKFLSTNAKIISIPLGRKILYFLPDRALLYNSKTIESIEYKDLNIYVGASRFVWSKGLKPRDSEIIDYTYAHMNTKGGPDRRYSVNPRIPILNFTRITFDSYNKLDEEIMVSKSNACNDFVRTFQSMKNKNFKSNNISNINGQNAKSINNISNADSFLNDAIDAVIETGQASTSFIQKRFKIGYARAGKIIDQMEEMGIVSKYKGSKPRDILVSKNDWENFKQNKEQDNLDIGLGELKEKIQYIYHIAEIMDEHDIGYGDLVKKQSHKGSVDSTLINSTQIIELCLSAFISIIVNKKLTDSDYYLLKEYMNISIMSNKINSATEFNIVTAENEELDPLDWYLFYVQKENINKYIKDNKYNDLNVELADIYAKIGQLLVNNGQNSEIRSKNYEKYMKLLGKRFKEMKKDYDEAMGIIEIPNKKNGITIIDDNKSLEELLSEINNLVGLENVKEDINSLINLIKVRKLREEKKIKQDPMSLHLVFSGNPGTGKTTVARIIAQIYHKLGVLSKGVFVETDRSELVAGYVGQTAIKVKEICNSALGGILFIDEAYSLVSNKDANDFGKEAIDTLLKFMEDNRDDFIVIVAGYTELMEEFLEANPGLKSRFNKFLHFDDYNPDELFEIYKKLCEDSEFVLENDAEKVVREFFEDRYNNKSKNFANARDVRNYFEKTLVNQANRIAEDNIISNDELQIIKIEDVKNIKLKA